jgi:hypothetical protein
MRCRSGVCFDAELEHEESRPTAMKRDEQQVIDLIEYIQNHMTDEDNFWVYMGFNNFPRPTFKDTTLCQVFKRLQLGPGAHINPEIVFRRTLALANVREEVTVEKVLAYPIGQIPTALFHDDGLMRKSCKSDLIN